MTTGGKSARLGARAIIGKGMSAEESAALRRLERILDARALGHKVDRIAYDLRLVKAHVAKLITARRVAGDPRALTDKQALSVSRERQERQEAERDARRANVLKSAGEPWAPLDLPEPPAPASIASRAVDEVRRAWFVGRLHDIAAAYDGRVAAGLRHRADLHQHCDGFYPTLNIPSEGATLESTRRMFPPVSVVAYGGGAGAACLAD